MRLNEKLYVYPETGMFDCNTYVIRGEPTVIFDVGSDARLPGLVKGLQADGIKPEDIGIIVNTHLHPDHCGANQAFKELSGATLLLHPLQKQFYDLIVVQGARLFGMEPTRFKEDSELDKLGGIEMIPSPGHSPDSICYYSKEDRFLICGDVIFNMNTGRVDLPGGSAGQLKQSIENLSRLDVQYLLPGHMNAVSGVDKVKANFEFVRQSVLPWL